MRILVGHALDRLRDLPADSVHVVVTSPPYWGLRDYGVAGQIGLEPSPEAYVAALVEVFREVRRVLRSDGTLWLSLGDSYAGSWGAEGRRITESDEPSWHSSQIKNHPKQARLARGYRAAGLKPKDLIGVPWRVAFALQADGWWLRSDIILAKANPMPESVTDRPTAAHEHIFLLAKGRRYFYDAEAVKEVAVADHGSGNGYAREGRLSFSNPDGTPRGGVKPWVPTDKRNMRNVWYLASEPFPGAHFAVFATEIPRRAILAGSSEKGCCPRCGAPWARVVNRERTRDGQMLKGAWPVNEGGVRIGASGVGHWRDKTKTLTRGWQATCACAADDPVPCTILDPFGGAGTTGLVADRLGRDCVLIELNPDYAEMARTRLEKDAGLFADIAAD